MVGVVIFTRKLLKSLASSLGNQQSSEDTKKHEKSVNLKNVVHPRCLVLICGSVGSEDGNGTLADDGTDFTAGSRDTVGVLKEVSPAGLGDFEVSLGGLKVLGTGDFVGVAFAPAVDISLDVLIGLLDVTGDVKGVTRSLRDIEGNASGDSSEANKCSPHLVNSNLAISSAALCIGSLLKRRLEAEITTDTHAHDNTPEDDKSNKGGGRRSSSQGLSKRSKDDDDQLQTIHALSTDNIGQHTKAKLSYHRTGRSRQLDGIVRAGGQLALPGIVDDAEHDGQHGDTEDIVRVSEETDTCDDACSNMIPSKGSLVNLCKGETATLIGVGDVGKVVVEVVKGIISATRLCDGTRFLGHLVE
ncbi:hypothetical protein HG531_004951 [Fusarium graminearum]|nr:hypothetical protein HG531_004951 [Fusarium graminearum]